MSFFGREDQSELNIGYSVYLELDKSEFFFFLVGRITERVEYWLTGVFRVGSFLKNKKNASSETQEPFPETKNKG